MGLVLGCFPQGFFANENETEIHWILDRNSTVFPNDWLFAGECECARMRDPAISLASVSMSITP